MTQGPYWGSTNIRCHRTILVSWLTWHRGFEHSYFTAHGSQHSHGFYSHLSWPRHVSVSKLKLFKLCKSSTVWCCILGWVVSNKFEVQGSMHCKYVPKYNQQDATLHSLFISVNCSTCCGWVPHPSSGAQNCIYSIWYLSNRYCYLLLSWKSWQYQLFHDSSR